MVGTLLWRGMAIGLLAGLICFGFLKIAGEPQVDRAIAFESETNEAKAKAHAAAMGMSAPMEEEAPELVSRAVQSGIGLFTGVVVYSTALGGLFALAFAFVYGRFGPLGARATSALLAAFGVVAVYIVPTLKYPANPPSVGEPDTIGMRTALYFVLIAISIAAMTGATVLRRQLRPRYGAWNASVAAGAAYLGAIVLAWIALPEVNEVPLQFPADALWKFRMAALGAQAILWTTIGLLFGALTERAEATRLRFDARAS